MTDQRIENVIIVGSGPAGYTAALYTARANLEPLVIEGFAWGGLLQQTTDVENYPGFPEGIMGPAADAAVPRPGRAVRRAAGDRRRDGDRASTDGGPHKVHSGDDVHLARAVILAMGAQHRKLGVPGEAELAGRGVSYCATCDAAFFKDAPTLIVGGGDSAMEEAMFLSKFASKVAIVHRRDEFRASKIMLERARAIPNIEWLTPYVVEEFLPGEQRIAEHRAAASHRGLRNPWSSRSRAHSSRSATSRSRSWWPGQVETDPAGYVVTQGKSTLTNVPGVFAAGDLVDHTYRQAVTAAGSGCQAALDAEWYLRDNPFPLDREESDIAAEESDIAASA